MCVCVCFQKVETRQAAAYRLLSHDYLIILVVLETMGVTLVAPWSGVTVGHYEYTDLDDFQCLPDDDVFYFTLRSDPEEQVGTNGSVFVCVCLCISVCLSDRLCACGLRRVVIHER